MTYTYSLYSANEGALNISKVRLELGDNIEGVGVRPDNSNIPDVEIAYWLDQEGDDIMRTCARACDALARMWAKVSDISTDGRSENLSKIANMWRAMRDDLIAKYGNPVGMTSGVFSHTPARADGYSEYADE